jgi:hypothetical protein
MSDAVEPFSPLKSSPKTPDTFNGNNTRKDASVSKKPSKRSTRVIKAISNAIRNAINIPGIRIPGITNKNKVYSDTPVLTLEIPETSSANATRIGTPSTRSSRSSRVSVFSPTGNVSSKQNAIQLFNKASEQHSTIPSLEKCKVYLKEVINTVNIKDIDTKSGSTSQDRCLAVLDKCKENVLKLDETTLIDNINTAYNKSSKEKAEALEVLLKGTEKRRSGGKKTRKLRKRGKKNVKRRKTRRHR